MQHNMVVATLGLMLALASSVDSSYVCRDGFIRCLKMDVAKALNRIATLNKEKIVLLNGIHLDKYTNGTVNEFSNEINNEITRPVNNLNQLVKRTTHVFDTHYLLVEIVPGFNIKIYKTDTDNFSLSLIRGPKEHHISGARTFGFGARKRLQMALLPIMYKLGVITTLLVGLTVLTLKALTIGVILLILAFGGIFTKIKAVPWEEGYGHHNKDIHIHVHPFVGKSPGHWKTWQRQEELDQDPYDISLHNPQKHLQDQHQHHPPPPLLGSPPNRPYSYFPPSVSGLID